jgi:hypothetical protein
MKLKSYRYSALILLLIMIGCNSQAGISNTSAPAISATSSISRTPTLNFTLTPSRTLSPSDLTQINYMYTAAPGTLEAQNVKCKYGFHLERPFEVLRSSSNEWTLFTCSPASQSSADYGTRYTQLVKTDLSQTWVIQHNSFDYSEIDRQDAYLAPFRWTADGKYVYLFPHSYPGTSGGPAWSILSTITNSLYRVNLENGNFELVISNSEFSALEISPDDKFLVYSDWNEPARIHLRDLESSEDLSIKLNQDVIASGQYIWDPESEMVVFVGAQGNDDPDWEDMASTSVFVLTIKDMHVQEILSRDDRIFIPYDCFDGNYWSDENTICLYTHTDNQDNRNKFYSLNVKTGELIFLRSYP